MARSALDYIDTEFVVFANGTYHGFDVKLFRWRQGEPLEGELLAELFKHERFGDDHISPGRPNLDVHGPYRTEAIQLTSCAEISVEDAVRLVESYCRVRRPGTSTRKGR